MKSEFSFSYATADELELLFEHRVEVGYWRGQMSRAQYLERTRRIFRHPFARQRIQTILLRDESGDICASMDILNVDFLVGGEGPEARRVQPVPLITSLVTPAAKRGRGHASLLLKEYEERNPGSIYFLYSDIGEDFYRRLGYRPFPMREVIDGIDLAADQVASADARPISLLALIQAARQQCTDWVSTNSKLAVCLPDEQFTDWQVERYRSFAAFDGRCLPPNLYWFVRHPGHVAGHVVALVPDLLVSQLDCLWLTPGCQECVGFAEGQARAQGLKTIRYWTHADSEAQDCVPMLKTSEFHQEVALLTPQLSTWF